MEKEENDDEDCPSADARLHESPASLQSITYLEQLPIHAWLLYQNQNRNLKFQLLRKMVGSG
jgi:hypothetical protein